MHTYSKRQFLKEKQLLVILCGKKQSFVSSLLRTVLEAERDEVHGSEVRPDDL